MPAPSSVLPPWQDATLISRAKEVANAFSERAVQLAIEIAAIPAPTGEEANRAQEVGKLFRAEGLSSVVTDDINDVIATIPGRTQGQSLLLAAHTDTVFVRDTPLNIYRDETKAYGPGVGDNSLGIASVILMHRMITALGIEPASSVRLTGNVGEEGLGNLRGISQVLDQYPDIGAVVAVEGQNLGRITHIAVGSMRLRVTVRGPGGHSWGDSGNPSAIHAAAKLIHNLDRIPVTQAPKTTLSVGMINGGISINSIAPVVTFDLDLRSTDPDSLKRLVDRTYEALNPRDNRISVDVDILGERPAGQAGSASRIVTSAAEILRSLSCPPSADASSTDANAAIARGIPAICIGMTTGGNAHRMDEFIDLPPIVTGLAQLLLLTVSLADDLAAGRLNGS